MFRVSNFHNVCRVGVEENRASIDQFDAKSFNINECGVIRNDISQLARAQSQSEFDAIMRKVGSINPSFNLKDGVTARQAFDSLRPHQLQTPAELAGFAEYMANQSQVYADIHVPSDVKEDSLKVESPSPSVDAE